MKTFFPTLAAILTAAAILWAIKDYNHGRRIERENRSWLFDAAIQHEGSNWQFHHADEDPDTLILDYRIDQIRKAKQRGDNIPPHFPEDYSSAEMQAATQDKRK